jgi:hypothetical protein
MKHSAYYRTVKESTMSILNKSCIDKSGKVNVSVRENGRPKELGNVGEGG